VVQVEVVPFEDDQGTLIGLLADDTNLEAAKNLMEMIKREYTDRVVIIYSPEGRHPVVIE
jgi:hypothetical protein